MMTFKVELPLYVDMGSTRYHINLNNYHKWYRYNRNKIKQTYQSMLEIDIPKQDGVVELELVLHRGDRRKVDRSNVLCLHEKFACDALVKRGILEDDNDKFIAKTTYRTGEIDKENPRVDMFIRRVS